VTGGFRAFWLLINIYHIIERPKRIVVLGVGGLGVEVTIAKGVGKVMDGGLGEGGTAGAVQEGVEFVTHDFVGGHKRGNSVRHKG